MTRNRIHALVDKQNHIIKLYHGSSALVVPFSFFPKSGNGLEPDFSRVEVTDYGQTLKLGEYEASIDAIFYEYDSVYREARDAELVDAANSNSTVDDRLRRKNLNCAFCKPNRGENKKTDRPHGVKKPKYKDKRR